MSDDYRYEAPLAGKGFSPNPTMGGRVFEEEDVRKALVGFERQLKEMAFDDKDWLLITLLLDKWFHDIRKQLR